MLGLTWKEIEDIKTNPFQRRTKDEMGILVATTYLSLVGTKERKIRALLGMAMLCYARGFKDGRVLIGRS